MLLRRWLNISILGLLIVVVSTGCTTTKAKRKVSKSKPKTLVLPPTAVEACTKGLLVECEGPIQDFIRDGKLSEARDLALKLMRVRRSEGARLLNEVEDATKLRQVARASSQSACDDGSVRACRILGNTLINENNVREGLPSLQKACALGDANACHDAAVHVQDAKERQRLFARSCELKYAIGCYELGRLIDATGRAPAANRAFGLGCGLGHPGSCGLTARWAYTVGNRDVASNAADVACQGDVRFGCFIKAMMAGEDGNFDEARKVLTKLCVSDAFACRELGFIEMTQSRKAQASDFFTQACQRGDMPACMQLARQEYADDNRDVALALYRKLCDASEAKGCLNAALIIEQDAKRLSEKSGEHHNETKSLMADVANLLHRACELRAGLGCLKMGFQREVAKDNAAAQQYFASGCAAGEATACDLIGRPLPVRRDSLSSTNSKSQDTEEECAQGSIEACWTLTGLTELSH